MIYVFEWRRAHALRKCCFLLTCLVRIKINVLDGADKTDRRQWLSLKINAVDYSSLWKYFSFSDLFINIRHYVLTGIGAIVWLHTASVVVP